MATQALKHLNASGDRRISVESILRAVAERFSLTPAQLKMKSNTRQIAYPRQIAMYLVKELTHASLPEIGRYFGANITRRCCTRSRKLKSFASVMSI